jgi:DNA-binding GntR family transcriptional regulator
VKLALLQQGLVHPHFADAVADTHRELLAQLRARNEERATALLEEQLERFHQSALRLN